MSQYLTKEGLEKIKKELDYLKNVKRKEIAKLIQQAASFGDLKENFAYHQAKDEQAILEARILKLEETLKNSKIIERKNNGRVGIGSIVTVVLGKEKQTFEIVGREEANPLEGRISIESPLGKAILGKKSGDSVELDSQEGKIKYKIVKVE